MYFASRFEDESEGKSELDLYIHLVLLQQVRLTSVSLLLKAESEVVFA